MSSRAAFANSSERPSSAPEAFSPRGKLTRPPREEAVVDSSPSGGSCPLSTNRPSTRAANACKKSPVSFAVAPKSTSMTNSSSTAESVDCRPAAVAPGAAWPNVACHRPSRPAAARLEASPRQRAPPSPGAPTEQAAAERRASANASAASASIAEHLSEVALTCCRAPGKRSWGAPPLSEARLQISRSTLTGNKSRTSQTSGAERKASSSSTLNLEGSVWLVAAASRGHRGRASSSEWQSKQFPRQMPE
mmetsp:Transcript_104228/g.299705  ORF Transcript_104228/g.299705 Transcript_104228/m.299705 type:complete len:249 (+) Transcript_104228:646-1392(+)